MKVVDKKPEEDQKLDQKDKGKEGKQYEVSASQFSRLIFAWMTPLFKLGSTRYLEQADIPEYFEEDTANNCFERFEQEWKAIEKDLEKQAKLKENERSIYYMFKASARFVGWLFLYDIMVYIGYSTFQFAPPILLNEIIACLEGTRYRTPTEMWLLAFGLLILPLCGTLCFTQHNKLMHRIGLQLRNAFSSKIFRKAMVLSNAGKGLSSTGQIVNIMANDAEKPMHFLRMANFLWGGTLRAIVCIILIYVQIGNATWAGVALLSLLFPINKRVFTIVRKLRTKLLLQSDERVKLTNEVINGIRVVKFYNWEAAFEEKINVEREKELALLQRLAWTHAFGFVMILRSVPLILPLVVFPLASNLGVTITASKAFTTIALFSILRLPFSWLPGAFLNLIEAKVSIRRMQNFLLLRELPTKDVLEPTNVDVSTGLVPSIEIENLSYSWNIEERRKLTLNEINLKIFPGELVAVVGSVGSGKSSLLSAILNEIAVVNPTDSKNDAVRRKGSIAYVSQQAWILNATLRDNIVFGDAFDPVKYQQVIDDCALGPDLEVIKGGDMAEIGERGINISGGQKARIALARSVYLSKDIYLIDDSLSAVDAHVGAHIFNKCITGCLSDKTRVFVTNSLQYLSRCDRIIMLESGKIVHFDTYEKLTSLGIDFGMNQNNDDQDAHEPVDTNGLPIANGIKNEASVNEEGKKNSKKEQNHKEGSNNLTEAEDRDVGAVSFSRYSYYFKSAGCTLVLIWLCSDMFRRGSEIAGPFILSDWSENSIRKCELLLKNKYNNTVSPHGSTESQTNVNECHLPPEESLPYINAYIGIGLIAIIFICSKAIVMAVIRVKVGRILHARMLTSILRAPTRFFDTTPIGRILNRFASDTNRVDNEVSQSLMGLSMCLANVIGAYVAISISTYGFAIFILIPLTWLYEKIATYFRKTMREIKRLESLSRSYMFASFSEAINGASSIRAYNVTQRFIKKNEGSFTINTRNHLSLGFAGMWLSIRLDGLASILSFLVAVYATISQGSAYAIPPGWIGLGLIICFELTQYLKHGVHQVANAEVCMNSVERVMYYSEDIDQEQTPDKATITPMPSWPEFGKIKVSNLSMRYRMNLPLVLNDISFEVKAGEHVGVVGRTGAGKSSLLTAFFRIVEPENGAVFIDDVNTKYISLDALRSNLTIIPQDPCMFSTTVRQNLDPFKNHTDEELWEALAKCQMKEVVKGLKGKLNFYVAERGENFSVGQRQLLCIARALIRKPKVLMLDEATASIDQESDTFIQKTIREAFGDITVITIAHRYVYIYIYPL